MPPAVKLRSNSGQTPVKLRSNLRDHLVGPQRRGDGEDHPPEALGLEAGDAVRPHAQDRDGEGEHARDLRYIHPVYAGFTPTWFTPDLHLMHTTFTPGLHLGPHAHDGDGEGELVAS